MSPHQLLWARQNVSIPTLSVLSPLPHLFDESRAPQIVAGNAFLQLIGTLLFVTRVYSHLLLTKSWKHEDSLLTAAWVFATAFSICQYGQVAHGAGHHMGVVLFNNPHDPVESQKWAFAASILLLFALALPKLSICTAYLRIFGEGLLSRRMIQSIAALLFTSTALFSFLSFFQCRPLHVYWTEGRPLSKCSLDFRLFYIHGSINVFADLALMALVLPRVLELHVSRRQKWALIGIVSLGSLAAAAGILRMVRLSLVFHKKDFDASWDSYDVSIWTATEIYVSLICAAAPGIKPVIALLVPKLLGTTVAATLGGTTRTETVDGQAEEFEMMRKKARRPTIGSARTRRNRHDTILDGLYGPYVKFKNLERDSFGLGNRTPESPRFRKTPTSSTFGLDVP